MVVAEAVVGVSHLCHHNVLHFGSDTYATKTQISHGHSPAAYKQRYYFQIYQMHENISLSTTSWYRDGF